MQYSGPISRSRRLTSAAEQADIGGNSSVTGAGTGRVSVMETPTLSARAARLFMGEVAIEDAEHALVLRVIQPALAGLMDGSVSTLAPIFAVAFATQSTHTTFVVGMAAAVGAGISMAFSEGLSDTGELTGRGHPFRRGAITGGATFLGGVLHTLPFLAQSYHLALAVAMAVVAVELLAIA